MLRVTIHASDPAARRMIADLLTSAGVTVVPAMSGAEASGATCAAGSGRPEPAAPPCPADSPEPRCVLVVEAPTAARQPPWPVSPPRTTPAGGQRLSQRESEVLECIASGLTHGQTAVRLQVSIHSVNTYVKRLKAKLGHGNKAFLTRAAIDSGKPADGRPECP